MSLGATMKLLTKASVILVLALFVAASGYAEKILIPVAFDGEVNGAHGSRWTVELVGYNSSDRYIQVKPFGTCAITCPALPANPKSFFEVWPHNPSPGPGLFLYVNDAEHDLVTFNLRVRDVSRQLETWGTEIPVVRESEIAQGRPVVLLHIPNHDGFRTTLRIYDFPNAANAPVRLRIFNETSGALLDDQMVSLSDFGQTGHVPSQVTLNDFSSGFPADHVRVEITPTDPFSRIWAFASVTHDETQHVTTVTPQ